MGNRILPILLCCLLVSVANTNEVKADTSLNQATECFNQALKQAKDGATLKDLFERYMYPPSIAAQASLVQKRGVWKSLSSAVQQTFIEAVVEYVTTSRAFEKVNLDSVTLLPRQGKAISPAFELPGKYKDKNGEKHTFVFRIVAQPKCRIIDGSWNNAWLSKVVVLPK